MSISLGQRIKQARKKVGLTKQKLAKRLGIDFTTLNKYENGHRTPDAELLAKIVKIPGNTPWKLCHQ